MDRQHRRLCRVPGLHPPDHPFQPAGVHRRERDAIRLQGPVDRVARRPVLLRNRRHQPAADPADHPARIHLHSLVVECHHHPGPGVLLLLPDPADGDAGRLHGPGLLPLLRLLGSHAGAHVLHHRDLGRPQEAVRRHQVLPLHAAGIGPAPAGNPGPLLSPVRRQGRLVLRRPGLSGTGHPARSPVLDLPGHVRRVRHQGSAVSLPHLAPGRPRRGSDGRLGHPGRGAPQDGHLWFRPLQPPHPARRHHGVPALDDGHLRDRDHLRGAGGHDAEGHEETGGVLLRQPPGILHAGGLHRDSGGAGRRHPPDDQPWDLHRSPLPDRGDHLRAPAHPHDQRLQRPVPRHAGVRRRLSDHDPLLHRHAHAQRIHRRVHGAARGLRRSRLQALGRFRRHRHRAGGGLHALALPAGDVRNHQAGREPKASGPDPPGAGDLRPPHHSGLLDRPLPGPVPVLPARARQSDRGEGEARGIPAPLHAGPDRETDRCPKYRRPGNYSVSSN